MKDIKKQLEDKKVELEKRLEGLHHDKTRGHGILDPDLDEQAVQLENDEVVDRLESIELKELKLVNLALKRMEMGQFGICADCGDTISKDRLKARPFSLLCINCAE